ncbi:MAG: TrkA family potassium uptake protein [Desulfobacterales bacterium]
MGNFAVIGAKIFGYYLATALGSKGHEVLVLDIRDAPIQRIKNEVDQAVVADATDKQVLAALGIQDADAAVVCIGSNMQASILVTLHLKEIGVQRILARAKSEDHGRILKKVGADEIYFPQKDLGLNLAAKLDNPNMIDYLPFMKGYSIIEIRPPKTFHRKTLKELDLINRFGVQILAVRSAESGEITFIPTAAYQVRGPDSLIALGPEKALAQIQKF